MKVTTEGRIISRILMHPLDIQKDICLTTALDVRLSNLTLFTNKI